MLSDPLVERTLAGGHDVNTVRRNRADILQERRISGSAENRSNAYGQRQYECARPSGPLAPLTITLVPGVHRPPQGRIE